MVSCHLSFNQLVKNRHQSLINRCKCFTNRLRKDANLLHIIVIRLRIVMILTVSNIPYFILWRLFHSCGRSFYSFWFLNISLRSSHFGGPLVEGMVVSRRVLGAMTRNTAINIFRRRRLEIDKYVFPCYFSCFNIY